MAYNDSRGRADLSVNVICVIADLMQFSYNLVTLCTQVDNFILKIFLSGSLTMQPCSGHPENIIYPTTQDAGSLCSHYILLPIDP